MTNRIDPITTEIIRNAFISIANDMNATLIRSAYTPIIYEGKDCSVALLDENGDVLGQSLGLPLFLGNLEICVKLIAEKIGWENFKSGDVFYMNDSYMTGTHLNDSTIVTPIFWRDRRVGFTAARAHWLDIGAKDPGAPMDSHEIYQEGMRWGPTRLYEYGEPKEEILDFLQRNSRFGYGLIGDMNAQIAACRTGEIRLQAVLDRFGQETVGFARDEIFRQSEELERESVSAIPDGVYRAEGRLDDDGLGSEPIPIKVKVEISGDQMKVDLTGSADQTRGPVNCGFAQTISAVRVAFKLLVNPDRPVDGGTFRTLKVEAPEGSLFRAQVPAACAWYFTPLGLLIDLIPKALAEILKDSIAAAHYGDSMVIYVSGKDPRKNDALFLSVEPTPGGWGAYESGDGQDALINNVNGSFKDLPIEVFENKYPMMLKRYGFRTDTGGAGRTRGGTGIYREYHMETPSSLYLWFERSMTPAWGVFGGREAAPPDVVVNPGSNNEQHLLKANALPLETNNVVLTQTGGGGGFGPPWERSPEAVRNDVLDRYVSIEGAGRDYGVVLNNDLTINESATMSRRKEMQP